MQKRSGIGGPLLMGGIGGYLFIQLFPTLLKVVFGLLKMVVSTALFVLGVASKLALPAAVFYLFRYLLSPETRQASLPEGQRSLTGRTEATRSRAGSERVQSQARGYADLPAGQTAASLDANPLGPVASESESAAREEREPDDLKIIEGIGPAISRLLIDHGIRTFSELANAEPSRLDEILEEANLRRIADPSSWAEQARIASTGDWDRLQEYQNTLKAGRTQ